MRSVGLPDITKLVGLVARFAAKRARIACGVGSATTGVPPASVTLPVKAFVERADGEGAGVALGEARGADDRAAAGEGVVRRAVHDDAGAVKVARGASR